MLNSLTPEIEKRLRSILPESRFAHADSRYLQEPRGRYAGQAGLVVKPQTTNEVAALIADLHRTRSNIWWIKEMLPHEQLTAMLTAADLFICPSISEPLGIVNLEAMACETAVLGSRVGGIPEVVADKETGELITSENLKVHPRMIELYKFFKTNGKLIDIKNYDPEILEVFSRTILELIAKSKKGWEEMVPEGIADLIKSRKLFGYSRSI